MSDPVISVVMGVRNGVRHLRDAVLSVLRQSIREIELIAVDDGSTDGTRERLLELARLDGRLIVLEGSGSGLAAALNQGAQRARGQWIARMDADDICHPCRLARQLRFAEERGLDVCGTDIRVIGRSLPRTIRHSRSHEAIRLELLFASPFAHPTVLAKAHWLRGAYDESVTAAQDFALWSSLAIRGARMGNLDAALLKYRVHNQQVTATRREARIRTAINVAREYWPFLFPGELAAELLTERTLRAVFDKALLIDDESARELMRFLNTVLSNYGDPEGVVSRAAFNVLIRTSAEIRRSREALDLVRGGGGVRRTIYRARNVMPIEWNSRSLARLLRMVQLG
jgi:glycosyltransferase involved in cell wall biosynthesis